MWNDLFSKIKKKEYFKDLLSFLNKEYNSKIIYPKKDDLFKCFKLCQDNNIKVVIIGQDPYHEANQANGLCFSVNHGVALPPSLINIYKEIEIEYGIRVNQDGDLTYLAKQGVLLLNKYLTVVEHKPLSHKVKEYDLFFEDVMQYIDNLDQHIVFLLWGREAQKVEQYINNKKHLVIKATHPSPLGANKGGRFNMNTFKKCDSF